MQGNGFHGQAKAIFSGEKTKEATNFYLKKLKSLFLVVPVCTVLKIF
jgi:hypothetical protein